MFALTDDGDVWWEGLTDEPPAHPDRLQGRDWTPAPAGPPPPELPVHRGRGPVSVDRPGMGDPAGVPISASCSAAAAPRRYPWSPRRSPGSTRVHRGHIASEKTAAAEGTVGNLAPRPFAMLPFCGYNMGDYFGHC